VLTFKASQILKKSLNAITPVPSSSTTSSPPPASAE